MLLFIIVMFDKEKFMCVYRDDMEGIDLPFQKGHSSEDELEEDTPDQEEEQNEWDQERM